MARPRRLALRARRRQLVLAGSLLLALAAALAGWQLVQDEDEGTTFAREGEPGMAAPEVVAPMIVYVSLHQGVDVATVARAVGLDPAVVRRTAAGFHEFPVPQDVAPADFESRLRSTPGVATAERDRTEDIVLQ